MKYKAHQNLPNITFIIPTLNAGTILPRCLMAIRSQDYPQQRIEIIVSDGGSTDDTKDIAKTFHASIIHNPEILHEHGKTRATNVAHGDILFFTDADNVLSHKRWLRLMIQPYLDYPEVAGFLPQTIPAPDSNPLDRYLGYLFTDPMTWFIYGKAGNPNGYEQYYDCKIKTKHYQLYRFPTNRYPLFGFSQGVGMVRSFKRDGIGYADDLLGGIKMIQEGKLIAYVPEAGVYHYHVSGFKNFISKYRWRARNNMTQKVKGMGLTQRTTYYNTHQKIRLILFLPYAFSLIFPFIDGCRLSLKYKDRVMLLHPIATLLLGIIIIQEIILKLSGNVPQLGAYK